MRGIWDAGHLGCGIFCFMRGIWDVGYFGRGNSEMWDTLDVGQVRFGILWIRDTWVKEYIV